MFSGHHNLHLAYLPGVLKIVTLAPEYEATDQSQFFPNLDLNLMIEYIRPDQEPEMARAWRLHLNA